MVLLAMFSKCSCDTTSNDQRDSCNAIDALNPDLQCISIQTLASAFLHAEREGFNADQFETTRREIQLQRQNLHS
jgi:hypothetical protein